MPCIWAKELLIVTKNQYNGILVQFVYVLGMNKNLEPSEFIGNKKFKLRDSAEDVRKLIELVNKEGIMIEFTNN